MPEIASRQQCSYFIQRWAWEHYTHSVILGGVETRSKYAPRCTVFAYIQGPWLKLICAHGQMVCAPTQYDMLSMCRLKRNAHVPRYVHQPASSTWKYQHWAMASNLAQTGFEPGSKQEDSYLYQILMSLTDCPQRPVFILFNFIYFYHFFIFRILLSKF